MSPYKIIVYGKHCHLALELKYKATWAIKKLNFDFQAVKEKRLLQLNELEELRNQEYGNAIISKDKTKMLNGQKIMRKEFRVGELVLLYNSRLKLFQEKLKLSRLSAVFFGLGNWGMLIMLRSDGSLCVFRRRKVVWVCVVLKIRMMQMFFFFFG